MGSSNQELFCGGKLLDCYPPVTLYGDSSGQQDVAGPLHFLCAGVALVRDVFPLLTALMMQLILAY
jgi:hypothetical protein